MPYQKHLYLYNITVWARNTPASQKKGDKGHFVCRAAYALFDQPRDKFIFQIDPSEIEAMARFRQMEFATLTLTADDKKGFEQWVETLGTNGLEVLNQLLGAGFKTSVNFVVDQSAFCFSIIGTEDTKKHEGMVMTSWSDDLEEAIFMGAYKHFVMCGEEAWPTRDSSQRWG